MKRSGQPRRFRIWIAGFKNWRPRYWHEVPPTAQVIEPVDERCYSAAQAAAYVEGFNLAALERRDQRWAISAPVAIQFEGDLRPGQMLIEGAPAGAPSELQNAATLSCRGRS